MTVPVSRFHQTSPYGLRHRLRAFWRRTRGGGLQKAQQLYFVSFNGHRYKRVVFQDTGTACAIEDRLERLGFDAGFPPVVTRFENEIWLEFIKGRSIDAGEGEVADALADFYAGLYRRSPEQQPLHQTRLLLRLDRDLQFLEQMGVIDGGTRERLQAAGRALAPETLWTGFDYVDPVLKNLIFRQDGRGLCAVDVESLVHPAPLGIGVAKAMLHWLQPWETRFWARMADLGTPDLAPAYPFVDLCFTARWCKTKVLTGKGRLVHAGRFQRFCNVG